MGGASSLKGKTIIFCGDGSGWPPYTYFSQDGNQNAVGYDIDVVAEILKPHGIIAEFAMPSWKTCLKLAGQGKVYQVALSATHLKERLKYFTYTRPYYHTVQSYFYSKERFKKPPVIKGAHDLFTHGLVCGRYSYSYEGAGVLQNKQLKRFAKSYKALISQTLNNHCAFFIGRPSVLLGFKLIGEELMNSKHISYAPIPKAKKDEFHMLISRNLPYAQELKRILDEGIKKMEKSGRLNEILKAYYLKMKS